MLGEEAPWIGKRVNRCGQLADSTLPLLALKDGLAGKHLNLNVGVGSVEELGQSLIFLALPIGAGECDDNLFG
jgi:hypothetical protein